MKLYLSVFTVTLFTICSCNNKVPETKIKTPFCLTDTLQKKAVIEVVKLQIVKNAIALSGKIEANEDKWIKVYPVVGGVVEEMKVQLGDYVTKGQNLAVIRSGEIADYQSQLSYAQSSVKIANKTLTSTKELFKSGLTTEKDVVTAETDLEKAAADLKRMEQTTSIYGAKSNAMQIIVAPVSGFVIEKNITDKMQYKADATQPFFIIANLDEVWVMASVFESDIAKIKIGYDAEVNVIAYKDKTFTGKVDRIFSILDPQSRVMKVRIKIPNKNNLLKPEMFAQITIKYNDNTNQLPAIPSQAIIFDKNRNYVMVYKDKCDIETREIEIYEVAGNTTYIKSGLKEGEKIITKYQLLVYDALND
ncbi:MAG TPA: efflux RND transporter periplasmic adaptor subunit [Chitinophagaceae bacterium]|jgi:membrane fusion protein, heavy metal efflux system|nr:efflux RND transporter periplasmic adaptor subunit [Chitinophagaceae bacterium]